MAKTKTAVKEVVPAAPAAAPAAKPVVSVKEQERALLAQLAQDEGSGFEEASRDAFAIPFLKVLQDLSPQTKSKMQGYVKGAEPGMIFHTVSQELAEDIRVVPCYFSQVFIEWIPRAKGGGFVKAHDPAHGARLMATTTRDGARNILPSGNELQDTRQHFVLLLRPDGTTDGCLIAMTSTQLKVSRRWMANMRAALELGGQLIARPAMYARSYRLGSEEEANDQGSWYSWTVTDAAPVTDMLLYKTARAFCESLKAGAATKVNYEELNPATEGNAGGAPGDLEDDNELDA